MEDSSTRRFPPDRPNARATSTAASAAASVGIGALIAFVIVIVVYQQIENYVLQPTIIGKAARISGFSQSFNRRLGHQWATGC